MPFPAIIRWKIIGEPGIFEVFNRATNLDFFIADIPTEQLPSGKMLKIQIEAQDDRIDSTQTWQIRIGGGLDRD